MKSSLRLFIAVHLPPDLLAGIGDVQGQLRQEMGALSLRWTRPEGSHLTLKFLGETAANRVEGIVAALQAAAATQPGFTLTVAGLGCFPTLRRPNVIWVGVQDPDRALQRLAAAVDGAMAGLGWQAERRPFNGHLTLARVKQGAGVEERSAIAAHLARFSPPDPLGLLPVRFLHLMHSDLQPGGSIYTELAKISLV